MVGQEKAIEEMQKRKPPKINPLRILRGLLRSEDYPLTQAELAKECDIPVDTVRNVENDRRKLSQAQLHKIKHLKGAEWDSEREVWHLYGNPDIPYTAELAEAFRSKWMDYYYNDATEAHVLCRQLIELFAHVEPESYNTLFYRLYDALGETREALHINGARAVFEKTKFQIELLHGAATKKYYVQRNFELDESIVKRKSNGREDWLNLSWLIPTLRFGRQPKKGTPDA